MITELLFLASSLILLVAGTNLARYGEAVAEKTRVSVTWVGLFLVAAVTSLPELFTGVSSILVVDEPDLAAGDVLGSCLFNLSLAAVAGLVLHRVQTRRNDHDVYRVGSAYITMMLVAVGGGLAYAAYSGPARWLGLASALLVILYFGAIRHVFHVQARREEAHDPTLRFASLSNRRLLTIYVANSVAVVGVASLLPYLAREIAIAYALETSFVGTAILAAATSLPELVVVVAAIRQGAPSLAIGGLVGSNLFDLVILAIDDLFYAKGPLLAALDADHLATVGLILVATWLFVIGMPAARRPRALPLFGILLAYVTALVLGTGKFG